jgi:hypothetical protein
MIFLSFAGKDVRLHEAYNVLLGLAVITQMIPFLYLNAGLLLVAGKPGGLYHGRLLLVVLGSLGLAATCAALATPFIPPVDMVNAWRYEAKLLMGLALLALGGMGLFFRYARRKAAELRDQEFA